MKNEIIYGTIIGMLILASIASTLPIFSGTTFASPDVQVGVKTGDWMRLDYANATAPPGRPAAKWMLMEFLSVDGTAVQARATMNMSDKTQTNQTVSFDVSTGAGLVTFVLLGGQAVFVPVIPADSRVGDLINISGYGNTTILGETMDIYAVASRSVVYANLTYAGTEQTYYWDKRTGVQVQARLSGGMKGNGVASETNMWVQQVLIYINGKVALAFDPPVFLGLVIAIIVALVVIIVVVRRVRRRRRK